MWVANAVRALPAGVFAALVATGHASLPLVYVLGGLLLFVTASVAVMPLQEMPNRP